MPKKEVSPCKACEFRHPMCHGECRVYNDWAEEKKAEREYTAREKATLNTMWDYGGKKRRKK